MAGQDFTIRILVKGGNRAGLRLVEKSNWIGLALMFSRASYPDVKGRDEFGQSGVYLLADSWSRHELPVVYVGEAEEVRSRLDTHFKIKPFWNEGIVFTSKSDELNKAQVKYLEARLVELASTYRRCKLENGNVPRLPSLSEMDKAEIEGFLGEILLLLPTLGVSSFQQPESRAAAAHLFRCKGSGYDGQGWETSAGFVVQKGSTARLKTTRTFSESVMAMREELLEAGVLAHTGKALRFEQDFEFSSPSNAATLVGGMQINGRVAWKDSKGKTLKEVQEEKIG